MATFKTQSFITSLAVVSVLNCQPVEETDSNDETAATTTESALAPTMTVYVKMYGTDANDGTRDAPVRTLQRAHDILRAKGAAGVIHFLPGTYWCHGMNTAWTHFPGARITIEGEGPDKTIFTYGDGCDDSANFLSIQHRLNEATRLTLRNFTVEGRRGAISIAGEGTEMPSVSSENIIENVHFKKIGDKYKGSDGKAAILISRSYGTVVRSSLFEQVENAALPTNVHGIYATTGSGGMQIYGNVFRTISGESVKFRNYVNKNTVRDNQFINTAGSVHDDYNTLAGECPSWDNDARTNSYSNAVPSGHTSYRDGPSDIRVEQPVACSYPPLTHQRGRVRIRMYVPNGIVYESSAYNTNNNWVWNAP